MCIEQYAHGGGSIVGACVSDDDDVGVDRDTMVIVWESMCESVMGMVE